MGFVSVTAVSTNGLSLEFVTLCSDCFQEEAGPVDCPGVVKRRDTECRHARDKIAEIEVERRHSHSS